MMIKNSTAKLAMAWKSEARRVGVMVGTRNKERSTIGASRVRSTTTNPAKRTTPAPRISPIWVVNGEVASLVMIHRIKKSPAPSRTMPGASRRWRWRSPLSRSTRSARAKAKIPVGTLIQKIQRHET
jgi:hypothetical protein